MFRRLWAQERAGSCSVQNWPDQTLAISGGQDALCIHVRNTCDLFDFERQFAAKPANIWRSFMPMFEALTANEALTIFILSIFHKIPI